MSQIAAKIVSRKILLSSKKSEISGISGIFDTKDSNKLFYLYMLTADLFFLDLGIPLSGRYHKILKIDQIYQKISLNHQNFQRFQNIGYYRDLGITPNGLPLEKKFQI